MSEIGKRIIKSLEEFTEKLENGEEIEAAQVQRFETPDGPMHLRRKVVLNKKEDDAKTKEKKAD